MPLIRLLQMSLVLFAFLTGLANAQSAVPDHRYLYSRDVDFFGADLTNLFDTTQAACRRACSAQEGCVAFTFNSRSNACFPKSGIVEQQPYVGGHLSPKSADSRQCHRIGSAAAGGPFLSDADRSGYGARAGRRKRAPLLNF